MGWRLLGEGRGGRRIGIRLLPRVAVEVGGVLGVFQVGFAGLGSPAHSSNGLLRFVARYLSPPFDVECSVFVSSFVGARPAGRWVGRVVPGAHLRADFFVLESAPENFHTEKNHG